MNGMISVCDLIGRGVVGIIISQQNVVQDPLVDTNLATSMCAHFRIPCIAFDPKSTDKGKQGTNNVLRSTEME